MTIKLIRKLVSVLLICLSGTTVTAASNKLPDLVPVVVDAGLGLVEVRNVGEAAAKPSRVFVSCSIILAGKSSPCAAGLKLPGYIEKWHVLPYDIPALQPAEHYRFHVFGSDALPRRPGAYGMSITADATRRVEENNESNNATRLDITIRADQSSFAQPVSAGGGKGVLRVRVMMAGKSIAAAVRVTQAGKKDRVVLQTKSRRTDTYEHMKQTPFEVFLPAGRYDLYVQSRVSPLQVYMQTRALPIVINAGKRLDRTVTIPSGHLQVVSSIAGEEVAGMPVEISGGASYKNKPSGFDAYTIYKSLKTPVDADVPPGKYKIKVRNPETRQVQTVDVVIKEKAAVKKSLAFDKLHAGYLKLSLTVGGKKIPEKDFYNYVTLSITSTATSKQVKPGSADRLRLASDVYDVVVHELAWGSDDRHLDGIKISDDKITQRSISLQQPGELQLVSLWRTGKLVEAECAVIKPLVTAAVIPLYAYLYLTDTHLAAGNHDNVKMCYPDINPVVVTYTRLDKKNRRSSEPQKVYSVDYPAMKTRLAAIRLVPGRYDFSVWPLNHPELKRSLKNIKIDPGKAVLKELMFERPDE